MEYVFNNLRNRSEILRFNVCQGQVPEIFLSTFISTAGRINDSNSVNSNDLNKNKYHIKYNQQIYYKINTYKNKQ